MTNENRNQSLSTADVDSDANNGNRQILYEKNFGRLLDSCLESPQLFIADAERLVSSLAPRLNDFSGDTDQDFVEWATTILRSAVDRLCRFYDLKQRYSKVVHSAIWRTLGHTTEPNKLDDYS